MKTTFFWKVNILVSLFAVQAASAQPGGPMGGSGPAGPSGAMLKLFGDVKGFSSKAHMRMLDSSNKETMSMTIDFALLDGKTRIDMDLTQVKSAQLPPQAMAQVKQMGMDRNVVISLHARKMILMVYPGLKSFTEMPMPEEAGDSANYKMEKTTLAKETIDGHPCAKNKYILTGDDGKKTEVLAWNASDLNDFPVQTQFSDKGSTVIMLYKDVKITAPDAKLFEAPAGFTKYDNIQALMQGAMMKMLGGGGLPNP